MTSAVRSSSAPAHHALLLGDNQALLRLIAASLKGYQTTPVVLPAAGAGRQPILDWREEALPDLLILALSAAESEPLVALSYAGIIGWVGKMPILIICDRRFRSAPDLLIYHLAFPFSPAGLNYALTAIQGGQQVQ